VSIDQLGLGDAGAVLGFFSEFVADIDALLKGGPGRDRLFRFHRPASIKRSASIRAGIRARADRIARVVLGLVARPLMSRDHVSPVMPAICAN
jgi:hypothetical protein